MPYPIECFLEVNEIVEQVPLVLQMSLHEDPTVEDLFHWALKPACSSDSSSSALDFRQLRIMWNITLLEWLIRLIILWFLHCLRFPFFGNGINNDCVHSFGHIFCSQIHLHSAVRAMTTSLPPIFTSSEGTLSTPGDLQSFRLCTAASTSSFSIGRLSLPSVEGRLVCSNEVSGWFL